MNKAASRTPDFTIRPALEADSERIAELAGQLGYPSTPAQIAERLSALNGRNDHAIYVAASEGQISGWVHVFVYRSIEGDARAEVGGLVVDANIRSRGVGAQLLAAAEHWALQQSCRVIGLRSNVIRDRAHNFYERHGYRVIKTQKAFRKEL